MFTTRVTRIIAAPEATVFDAVADIRNFAKAVPDIVDVTFLSDQRTGVGTRFRETRRFGKREVATELEVTEYEAPHRIRLVSDAGGTVWDSVFAVSAGANGTELALVMEARPYKLLARLTTFLTKGMMRKALEKDMDAVKRYCEAGGR